MRRDRAGTLVRVVVAVAVGVLTTVAGYAAADAVDGRAGPVLGPGLVEVVIDIEHSRFSTDELRVRPGTTVQFLVRNSDPIPHELIVGGDEVHRAHARGIEPFHPPVPGEVSVGANDAGSTVFTFDEPGTIVFACHLPGHREYGMEGEVEVVDR